jgi:hypothetical protein
MSVFDKWARPPGTVEIVVDMAFGDPSQTSVRSHVKGTIAGTEEIPERTAWQ